MRPLFSPSVSCAPRTYPLGSERLRVRELPGAASFELGNREGEEDSWEDEQPRHRRQIHPFALAEFPVTQALWQTVYTEAQKANLTFDEQRLRPAPSYFSGPQRPVEQVSWDDAQEFCRVLNVLLDKPPDYFRLPTEAEWEYAARAGERKHRYAGSNRLAEVGWYDENSGGETQVVGQLAPNAFGLYDMSGNVFEWCADDWHDNYEGHPPDSRAWVNDPRSSQRVRRGGSWYYVARYCRCAYRYDWSPDYRVRVYGFRLACPSSASE